MEVCRELQWNPWEFLAEIKEKSLHLSAALEDWMDEAHLDQSRARLPTRSD